MKVRSVKISIYHFENGKSTDESVYVKNMIKREKEDRGRKIAWSKKLDGNKGGEEGKGDNRG